MQGYNAPKTSLSLTLTVNIKQCGHALLHLDTYNEDFLITLPPLHVQGLITGSPSIELSNTSYIQSSSGFTAEIEYSGKGWRSGKKNSFAAKVYAEETEKDVLFSIEGQWTESFALWDVKAKKEIQTYNTPETKTTPLTITPEDKQDPLESRKAWRAVVKGIEHGDQSRTSVEKSKIENQQRDMRRQEQAEGRRWESRYFRSVANDPILEKLSVKIGKESELEETGGIWTWDEKKANASWVEQHATHSSPEF